MILLCFICSCFGVGIERKEGCTVPLSKQFLTLSWTALKLKNKTRAMIFVPVNVFVILVHTLSIERTVLFSVEWLSNTIRMSCSKINLSKLILIEVTTICHYEFISINMENGCQSMNDRLILITDDFDELLVYWLATCGAHYAYQMAHSIMVALYTTTWRTM